MADQTDRRFDAVLFDFSGVLVDSAFHAFRTLANDEQDGDEVLELLLGPYGEDTDHPWHQVERGERSMAEWWSVSMAEAERRGIEINGDRLATWFASLDANAEMLDLVRDLRAAGHATAIVTNNIAEAGEAWRAKLPIDELFDVVVDSCEVGMRKPNPAIFELALVRLGGVGADRALFLDDHPGNVAGAERAGLAALLVDDQHEAVVAVRAMVGLPDMA